ncbi:class I SAM-dependent methyltransferase [Psychrobacillus sp. FJAT-51614]|uniref:Class I SAM-dependent methyltransferase n=1 Tax=Psychrobacillus mangrovi TaxID=3117745 RepID=A0ABU8EZX5_9BACI
MKTIVTTAGRTNELFIEKAQAIAAELSLPYINRQKKSVKALQERYNTDVLVVSKERLEFYAIGTNAPFFFHPNSAAFRLKRLLKGEPDLFLEATNLKRGNSFFDTTAGLCSDSIIAAYATGDSGTIYACEVNQIIAYIVSAGLKSYETDFVKLKTCMQNVNLVHMNAMEALKAAESNSYDVVYMDPMFEELIEESSNFEILRSIGHHYSLTIDWVEEAKRVAKQRVVVKAHFRSGLFENFGFHRLIRQSSKFHYGIIEI